MPSVFNLAGIGQVTIDRRPDMCPVCHTRITPNVMTGGIGGRVYDGSLTVVFICPSDACREYFLGYYEKRNGQYGFLTCRPKETAVPTLPDFVVRISANYCDMYQECYRAEAEGLRQVAGFGYRKALEFLIKDYVVSRRPEDRAAIEATPLATCIETYVGDANVRDVGRRAVWLGQDGAQRAWTEKDLRDLKSVIELVLRWIETEYLTEELLKTMPPAPGGVAGEDRVGTGMHPVDSSGGGLGGIRGAAAASSSSA
ncbi:MAG TPA: hypothetical protein VL752_19120 [Acidisoma sp.]|uniref:hypothetical protein n=1 Tax=Acidisoma sp. TaxID=1872115 RepID=UPI002CFF8D61|nr:hypothetical protein [Acidisoma sp.]HTI03064.1 hypothetical protein [Acidisoma sp.]